MLERSSLLRPAALALLAPALCAQVEWTARSVLPSTAGQFGYDYVTGRPLLVRFGVEVSGAELWEWNGSSWGRRLTATAPSTRWFSALCDDPIRSRILLFGGQQAGSALDETWEYDGNDWRRRLPVASPPPRIFHALAFDPVRARAVLFGGITSEFQAVFLDDTWEWDGTNWTHVPTPTRPLARRDHALAYHASAARMILFGGENGPVPLRSLQDTWMYDGTNWTQSSPLQRPPPRKAHTLISAHVRARVVLFGGRSATALLDDTWEWDGSNWQQLQPIPHPAARADATGVFDYATGSVVLWGGESPVPSVTHGDLWRWDGLSWTQLAMAQTPPWRERPGVAFDQARGRLVMVCGIIEFSDHWEWDGSRWQELQQSVIPPARRGTSMVYDSWRGRCVLFGGNGLSVRFDDVWEWDGSAWTNPQAAVRPSPRHWHAMAFDAARGRTVMFGGDSGGMLNDTWEWDGTQWIQAMPSAAPAARYLHSMAFDDGRGEVVMQGGPSLAYQDTWEWNGTRWALRSAISPTGSSYALAYDAARGRVVALGAPPSETWEWDGSVWTLRIAAPTGYRGSLAFAYDSVREKVVLSGGPFGEHLLWEYGPVHPAATNPFGVGCAASSGSVLLASDGAGRPWLGDTVTLRISPVPPAGVALFALGLSRTAWNGNALPFALDALGMPGCTLLASIDALSPAAASGGAATIAVTVPNQPSLLGLEVFAQAAALDPAANAFGAVTSNALALRVGGR